MRIIMTFKQGFTKTWEVAKGKRIPSGVIMDMEGSVWFWTPEGKVVVNSDEVLYYELQNIEGVRDEKD